jgi:hypothetical protein
VNTHFLPDIDFKNIINDELSEKTKQIIWKYLQLILFTVIGTIKEKDEFGDYEKMFADVIPKELQEKNQRNHIEHDGVLRVRRRRRNRNRRTNPTHRQRKLYTEPDELNDHLSGLFQGKIGTFAKNWLKTSPRISRAFWAKIFRRRRRKDIMFNLMKNPNKISGLVKRVTSKLQEKIASGEISNEELMKEASEMMGKLG